MATNPIAESFAGLDNKSRPEELGPAWFDRNRPAVPLREALNVDLTDAGGVERRQGFSLVCPDIQHSLWANPAGSICLGVGGGQLRKLSDDFASSSNLLAVADQPMAYAQCENGNIHFSNNRIHGVFDGATAQVISKSGTYERSSYKIEQSEELVYYDGPPPGYLLEWAFGRLWVVDADDIWYSLGYEPEKFDCEVDYVPWVDVTMFKATTGGFYVGTTKAVHFLPGGNPKAWVSGIRKVSDDGAVLGTALLLDRIAGKVLPAPSCLWESTAGGKVLGSADGQVTLLSGSKVSWPTNTRGASVVMERSGRSQHVTIFPKDGEQDNNFRTADFAGAEIRRNGVLI